MIIFFPYKQHSNKIKSEKKKERQSPFSLVESKEIM